MLISIDTRYRKRLHILMEFGEKTGNRAVHLIEKSAFRQYRRY